MTIQRIPALRESYRPLYSVCCTTYNMENYLQDTLEGFTRQTIFEECEIIIHDDASTDRTPEILREFQKNHPDRVYLILQSKNQYADRNVGLGEIFYKYIAPQVRGKFIALCDGDDAWTDPNKVKYQTDYLDNNRSYSACFTNAELYNKKKSDGNIYTHNLNEGHVDTFKLFVGGGGIYPTSSLLFRRDALFKSEIYPLWPEIAPHLAWDTLFLYSLLQTGRIAFIDKQMSIYRRREDGIFSSIKKDQQQISERSKQQLLGLLRLLPHLSGTQRTYLRRKISIESLYILRHNRNPSRIKYLKHLHPKEFAKLLIGQQ